MALGTPWLSHGWFVLAIVILLSSLIGIARSYDAGKVAVFVGGAVALVWLCGYREWTGLIGIARWLLRHPVVTVGSAVVMLLAPIILERVEKGWERFGDGARQAGAGVLGFTGGLSAVLLIAVGAVWIRRYQVPLGAPTTVPVIKTLFPSYVALGDSYSAGEGLAPYLPQTGDPPGGDDCHRSERAYSQQLRFIFRERMQMQFLACSGARSGELFPPSQMSTEPDHPPQVTPGTLSASTGLITLTIGGNDAHFSDVVSFCFLRRDCLHTVFDPGPRKPDEVVLPPPAPLIDWAGAALPVIEQRLAEVFARIRKLAPTARVIVIGYPPLLPAGGAPSELGACSSLLRRLDQGEREGILSMERQLNQRIYAAAVSSKVEYIDPSWPFLFHEACGLSGEMINGAKTQALTLDRGAFHPRSEGQRSIARQLSCYLNQHPEALSPRRTIRLPNGSTLEFGPAAPAPGSMLFMGIC